VLSAAAPLALKALVDALAAAPVATGLPASAMTLGAVYLLALCSGRLLAEMRLLLTSSAEQALSGRLSRRFFAHVLALPMVFHVSGQSGALAQSLRQASMGCQLLVVTLVNGIAPVLIEVAAVLGVLLHLDQPALVLSFAASAAVYLLVCGIGAFRLRACARAVSDSSLAVHATLADNLINIETIKCFTAEAGAQTRFAGASAQFETCWMRLHKQRAKTGLAVTATFAVSTASSLAIAAQALGSGVLSIGGFVLVTVYLLQLVRPLELLGAAARDAAQAMEFIRPLLDVLRLPTETSVNSAAPSRDTNTESQCPHTAALSLRGVHLAYDAGPPVLRGLDLDIAAGSTVAIVGASGSGKTSVARLLLRLHDPQSGHILYDGLSIDAMPVAALRAAIGLVPQDTVLFNASLADNIAVGRPGAQRCEIEDAARQACLHDFILSLPAGYDTAVGERGLKLSGGERQRVAIARALLKRPRVFIFDEATSMLDAETEAAILQNLQQVCQDCTTLIIAHRLSSLQHADEIIVLEQGQVAERGSPAALRAASGPYARLWRAQMGHVAAQSKPEPVPGASPCHP
jgi:ATP-binding cassette subfamily B protein